jgi:hypothetical protein
MSNVITDDDDIINFLIIINYHKWLFIYFLVKYTKLLKVKLH